MQCLVGIDAMDTGRMEESVRRDDVIARHIRGHVRNRADAGRLAERDVPLARGCRTGAERAGKQRSDCEVHTRDVAACAEWA